MNQYLVGYTCNGEFREITIFANMFRGHMDMHIVEFYDSNKFLVGAVYNVVYVTLLK